MLGPFLLRQPFRGDGGRAYVADIPPDLKSLVGRDDVLFLLQENDQELGPGDSVHQHIRDYGGGRFSVWQSSVYFSASDGSNCETNGRNYSLVALNASKDGSLLKTLQQRITQDDELLLSAVAANAAANNTVFANFFRYYHGISHWIRRAGLSTPKTVLEIGSGAVPYTALRFLLEGVERYVANEVMPIRERFPRQLISDLRVCCNQVAPELDSRWEKVLLPADEDTYVLRGLEIHPSIPFEDIRATGPFEFITSTSVMEHVMKPEAVFERMAQLCAKGGFVYHSIDLRDHRDFSRPLDFLTMTEDEYAVHPTENRLRASDFAALFERHGFEFVDGNWYMLTPGGLVWTKDPSTATAGVTAEGRRSFAGRFGDMDLHDLSTLAVQWLYRKK
ncbi:methyltransferase domain-containing protein [Bradyrhizobium sp. LHD-71]|uniref:methyltransferase domain-containing protein n=1 Tax=Bradyrhizobium sp. LHD-71 TaxID=3072141 RepID=UPI00280CE988|nr:methyltransferase domain-containing protein [Bradyrhizobium sp. LHD-71]MDQ8728351.1 methyltransferase domain-containing protein [Bradyrhizobium sp. LHD-71]